MNIQQQIENTERAIQYYTEMIEKYPENESMRFELEKYKKLLKEWKEMQTPFKIMQLPIEKGIIYEVVTATKKFNEEYKHLFTETYKEPECNLVDTFKEMESEIHALKQRIIQLECYDLEIEKEKNKKLRKQIKKLKEKLKVFKPK